MLSGAYGLIPDVELSLSMRKKAVNFWSSGAMSCSYTVSTNILASSIAINKISEKRLKTSKQNQKRGRRYNKRPLAFDFIERLKFRELCNYSGTARAECRMIRILADSSRLLPAALTLFTFCWFDFDFQRLTAFL